MGHRRPGLFCGPTPPAPPTAPTKRGARAARALVVGLNLPWSYSHCGYDFGPPPPGWRSRHPSPRDFEAELGPALREAHDAGVRVIRFFVFADGIAHPSGPSPTPLDPGVAVDLRALLDLCSRIGLRAIPSLVSFEWFFPPRRGRGGIVRRGRAELALGPGADGGARSLDAFFDATLEPLLRIPGSSGQPTHEAVFAWELVNEPDWCVKKHHVAPAAMSRFVERGVERIVDAGYVATVGFLHAEVPWLAERTRDRLVALARRGRYLHQIHHYPRARGPGLPVASASPFGEATLVGEMASNDAPSARWPETSLRASEEDPEHYLERRLELVETAGYRLALLWSRNANDEKSGFDASVREQIRRFTEGGPSRS